MAKHNEQTPLAMIQGQWESSEQWDQLTARGVLWSHLKALVRDENTDWAQVKSEL